jgi:hypothetical protein
VIRGRFSIGSLVIGSLFGFADLCYATKPCPPSPCVNESNQFDEAACRAKSDWIAVGTISNVVHKREGQPTNKDFATFTLRVQKWELGGKNQSDKLTFRVGWCENQQELPADTSGLFRFYGTLKPAPVSGSQQYYYFEAVKK